MKSLPALCLIYAVTPDEKEAAERNNVGSIDELFFAVFRLRVFSLASSISARGWIHLLLEAYVPFPHPHFSGTVGVASGVYLGHSPCIWIFGSCRSSTLRWFGYRSMCSSADASIGCRDWVRDAQSLPRVHNLQSTQNYSEMRVKRSKIHSFMRRKISI